MTKPINHKLSKNFKLKELVHLDIIERVGIRAADFLHPCLVPTLQVLRDKFGPAVVNGVFNNRTYTNSGLRLPNSSIGAPLSTHRFGNGADVKFKKNTPLAVQNYILNNQDIFPHITRLENAMLTKTWLHLEVGDRKDGETITVFNP